MMQYNDVEMKVRKRWLWLVKLMAGFTAISYIIIALGMSGSTEVRSSAEILGSFAIALFVALSQTVTYYILYRSAYKKPGTKYLTFVLFVSFISEISEFVQLWKSPEYGLLHGDFSLEHCLKIGFILCCIVLTICWFVVSFQLRKINKKIQVDGYNKAIELVAGKVTSEELDIAYKDAKKWLVSKYSRRIKKLYKSRKKEIAKGILAVPPSFAEMALGFK